MDSPETQLFLNTFVNSVLPLVDGIRVDKVKDCIKLTVYIGPTQETCLVSPLGLWSYNDPKLMAKMVSSSMVNSLLSVPRLEILSIEVDKEDA